MLQTTVKVKAPSYYLFVCFVELGELHKGPSSVLSEFVKLVCLFVSIVIRLGLILDKSIYDNFSVGTSMINSTT